MNNILITGADGFIGKTIIERLVAQHNGNVRAAVRQPSQALSEIVEVCEGMDLAKNPDWAPALQNIDTVIHCAARVHVMHDRSTDPLSDFRKANTEGTLSLARQARAAGVKRFIFLSSLGVHGESTSGIPFKADDTPRPHSPYTQSKLEAEKGLTELTRDGQMSLVTIRPPLVYGPNAPGNFGMLMRAVKLRLPLPFGSVENKRSFVFLENLVDMIICCIDHPNAANQTFLVSDDEDLSTTQLLKKIGATLGKPSLLLPIPTVILHAAAKCFGKEKVAQQLLGSLQVDIEKTKTLLNWKPPVGVDDALRKTAGMQK
ncbi:UDP-glucose 4-epimerase family protein [Herbaspirillum huttiense]|uniref:UDP-glucose 4-epimerase family protein n=1 Tax=Herbaspirillum huttiense TaxID=863372 RepID=UPI0039AFC485